MLYSFFSLCFFIFISCALYGTAPSKGVVLVTGGAGYIGTQTCKALVEADYLPIVYDNLSTGHRESAQWGILEVGDIGDAKRLREVIDKHHPTFVIHFAALKSVGESVKDPAKYYLNNVSGSLTLFSVLKEKGIEKIIFSSSATVYGNAIANSPIREDAPIQPINPYGTTKWVVEKILQDFHDAYGWEYVVFRYFNAAGADLLSECGERGEHPINAIPILLQVAEKKRPLFKIFGIDYETKDGSCIRDFVHVADLADAHVKGLDYLKGGNSSVCLNLGSGDPVSVKQVIELVRKVTLQPIDVIEESKREGDPPYLVADLHRAEKLLGWKPKHSLETILKTEWDWIQKNRNSKK